MKKEEERRQEAEGKKDYKYKSQNNIRDGTLIRVDMGREVRGEDATEADARHV